MSTQPLPSQYVLKAGDSLDSLATDLYGELGNFRELAELNGLDIFDALPVGKKIRIPSAAEVSKVIRSTASTLADGLDLSALKQPETGNPHQLISWVL